MPFFQRVGHRVGYRNVLVDTFTHLLLPLGSDDNPWKHSFKQFRRSRYPVKNNCQKCGGSGRQHVNHRQKFRCEGRQTWFSPPLIGSLLALPPTIPLSSPPHSSHSTHTHLPVLQTTTWATTSHPARILPQIIKTLTQCALSLSSQWSTPPPLAPPQVRTGTTRKALLGCRRRNRSLMYLTLSADEIIADSDHIG